MFSCTSVASIVCVFFFFFPVILLKQGATRGMAQPSHSRNVVDLSSKDFTEHSCPARSPTRSNFPGSRRPDSPDRDRWLRSADRGTEHPFPLNPLSTGVPGSRPESTVSLSLPPSKLKAAESRVQESGDSPRLTSRFLFCPILATECARVRLLLFCCCLS